MRLLLFHYYDTTIDNLKCEQYLRGIFIQHKKNLQPIVHK